jgi:hypothetical protein
MPRKRFLPDRAEAFAREQHRRTAVSNARSSAATKLNALRPDFRPVQPGRRQGVIVKPNGCWVWASPSNSIVVGKERYTPAQYYWYAAGKPALDVGDWLYRTCLTPDCVHPDHRTVMPWDVSFKAAAYVLMMRPPETKEPE